MDLQLKNSCLTAQIDAEDEALVSDYTWRAMRSPHEHKEYIRGLWGGGRCVTGNWQVSLHRLIMGCVPKDGKVVTFIDRDPFNCQRSNLRITTRSMSCLRQPHHMASQHPVYKNIKQTSTGWVAIFQLHGRIISSCGWRTAEDAAHKYDLLALKYQDHELLTLNFPREIYNNGSYTMQRRKSKGKSTYWGVMKNPFGSYTAYVRINHKNFTVGVFKDPKLAAICRDFWIRRLKKIDNTEKLRLNFEDINEIPVENRFCGVEPSGDRWLAKASGTYCGSYDTPEEAASVHDEFILKLSPRIMPKLNQPEKYIDVITKRLVQKHGIKI